MIEKRLGFIGGGRVTRILLEGFKRKGLAFEKVVVSDINPEALKLLKERVPNSEVVLNNNSLPASGDIVFLALHPPAVLPALGEIRSALRPQTILVSLAPKITLAKISEILGGFSRIIRMIPNAPSLVNAGYNPVAFGDGISRPEKDDLMRLFSALGECPVVKEDALEAYAIVTGMGPTYFWFQWEELVRLGVSFGMKSGEARNAVFQMIEGAVKTLFHSNLDPNEVMGLIPVKPLAEEEERIREVYRSRLETLYEKIKS